MRRSSRGFTYIEMLVVITLLAVCFLPILRMFTESMTEVQGYREMGTAIQLGRDAMESVKNLRLTESQIMEQGEIWFPADDEDPMMINGQEWKVKRYTVPNTDPLEIHIQVFRIYDLKTPILELVSLMEDL